MEMRWKDDKKLYHKLYHQKWFQRNKERIVAEQKEKYNKLKKFADDYKKLHKCKNCGFDHPAALEFHHRNREEKEFEISMMIRYHKNIELIKKEIEKCDVLCVNCHRILHWNESRKEEICH